jgi:hypothetical protein
MSGEWQATEQLSVEDLRHVVEKGSRNVGSPKLRQAAALIAMRSAAHVRANGARLGRVMEGLLRHIVLPGDVSPFEAFMLAMFARRHATDLPHLQKLGWVDEVDRATNPKFEDWPFSKAVDVPDSVGAEGMEWLKARPITELAGAFAQGAVEQVQGGLLIELAGAQS